MVAAVHDAFGAAGPRLPRIDAVAYRIPAPDDYSQQLAAILSLRDAAEQNQALLRLAQCDLSYSQTSQFSQLLRRLPEAATAMLRPRKLAILSSATVDHIVPALAVAGLRRGLRLDTFVAPYGQLAQQLFDGGSSLAAFQPDVVLISLSARDFLSSLKVDMNAEELAKCVADQIGTLESYWTAARRLGATVLQQSFLNIGETLFGNLDGLRPGSPTSAVRALNQAVATAAVEAGVLLVDMDRLLDRHGLRTCFDNARWLQAKIEISPEITSEYADQVGRILAAELGLSKKCAVLDLDNTLWGGVIGDDGMDGIALGQGSAVGEAFVQFQQYVRQLKDRGIVLAVCSKNEHDTAAQVFEKHPDMVLSLDDISVFIANWTDKAANVQEIAKRLNLGLESLVMIDDNPAERARIRQALPMVAVPELPVDPANYVDCLANAGYFEAVAVTNDDLVRSEQYAANARREELAQSAASLDDYLRSLNMRMTAGTPDSVDLPRVTQLINKTNQFKHHHCAPHSS